MKKYTSIVACIATMAIATPGLAKTYDCKLGKTKANESWAIPPHIVIVEKDGEVAVIDGLIQEVHGKPIAGRIAVDNTKRTTFTWSVDKVKVTADQSSSSRTANFVYRLTYYKANGGSIATMKPTGYGNSFRAKGKCDVK